jgi:hypothetical protein
MPELGQPRLARFASAWHERVDHLGAVDPQGQQVASSRSRVRHGHT